MVWEKGGLKMAGDSHWRICLVWGNSTGRKLVKEGLPFPMPAVLPALVPRVGRDLSGVLEVGHTWWYGVLLCLRLLWHKINGLYTSDGR